MQIRKRSIVNSLSLERAAANIQIIISQAELIFIFNFTILMYPLMRLQVLLALQLNFQCMKRQSFAPLTTYPEDCSSQYLVIVGKSMVF